MGRPRRQPPLRPLGQRPQLVLVPRRPNDAHAHISAGGSEEDVTLVETDDQRDAIDAAYHAKHVRRYPTIVPSIVAAEARAATLKLIPRSGT